jgi:hypothetical protein
MKTGDKIKARLLGSEHWGSGSVVLVSENGMSIALAGDGLPRPPGGLSIHPQYGVMLLLSREEGRLVYDELFSGAKFELRGIDEK